MKSAFAGLLLGAAHVAHAGELGIGGVVLFGSQDKSITMTATNAINAKGESVLCVAAEDQGTAKHGYANMVKQAGDGHKPDEIAKYDSKTKQAYFCGLTTDATAAGLIDISSAPTGVTMKDGNKILVKFDGESADCSDKGTLSLEYTGADTTNKGSIAGSVFNANVKSKIEFGCRKAQAFSAGVTAELKVQIKDAANAAAIAIATNDPVVKVLERSSETAAGGDVYEKSYVFSHDLGTSAPHSFYYESGVCADENDLCFGALKTTSAQASQGADKASLLSTTPWAGDASVLYKTIGNCSTEELETRGQISQWDACEATQGIAYGGQGLLTQYDCPFTEGTTLSTETAEGECRYYGQSQKFYITCAGSVNDDGDALEAKEYAMGDSDFQRNIIYDQRDMNRYGNDGNGDITEFKYVPEISLNSTAVLNKEVKSGISSVVWELPFTITNPLAKLSDVSDIKVEEIGGVYKRSATLDSGILTFSTPPRSMNIKITGLIQSTCSLNREVLLTLQDANANKTALEVEYTTKGAGSFTSLGACDGRHEYNAPTGFSGMKVVGVHSPDRADASLESVKFCKAGKLTKEDCLADLPDDPSLQQGDDIVVIEHLCDRVANGYVGGLVELEDSSGSRDYFYAPVYCPGPCTESDVKNFKLDWEVDFKASVTDGKDKNKVEANQDDARYDGYAKDLKRYSFLASEDLCGVDGKILGGLTESQLNTSECGIFYDKNLNVTDDSDYDEREFERATEIRDAFQSCGETASGSPEVFLVQHMHVDLIGENDDLYFCHSQKLTL